MDAKATLDPSMILDESIQKVEEQVRARQGEIDTRIHEWVSLGLTDLAFKRTGLKRKSEERKQLAADQLEHLTKASNLWQKKQDLEQRLQALLELRQNLQDPDIAQAIDDMRTKAAQLSQHPTLKQD